MLLWVLLVGATILAVEVAMRLPLMANLTKATQSAKRALQVIQASAISDHWKEKVLPAYAKRLLSASLLLFVLIVAIALPFFVFDLIGRVFDVHLMERLMTISGLIASMVPAIGWVFLRNRLTRG